MEKNVTHDNESEKLEHEQEPRSLRTRLLHLMGVMTIEPMLFFQFLGLCLKSVAESQMILYKTCRGKILNMTLAPFGQEIKEGEVVSPISNVYISHFTLQRRNSTCLPIIAHTLKNTQMMQFMVILKKRCFLFKSYVFKTSR